MRNDYYDTEEFKQLLKKYEASEEQDMTCYFDAEEFVDIADFYLLSDRPEEAIAAVDKGLTIHKDDEELLSTKSGAYIYLHRFDEAREIIDTLDPEDSNVLYQRAQLAYAIENDVQTAEELFADWIEKEESQCKHDPEDVRGDHVRDAYLHIITSFIELTSIPYDEELVKRWVEEYFARFAPLGSYECDLVLADLVRNENLTDMVEKIYSSLLEYDPYINYGWIVLSSAQLINGRPQEALESIEFALAIDPDNIDAILNKAHAYYHLGQKDKALPYFERFLSAIDDETQYLPYAMCLLYVNRVEEAIPYLKKADEYVKIQDERSDFYIQMNFELAEAFLASSMIPESLACITRTTKFFPDDVDCLLLEGTIHMLNHDIKSCSRAFTRCVHNAKDKILITCTIARRFLWQQQYEISLQLLEGASLYDPNDSSYRLISGYFALTYLEKGEYEPFLEYLRKACDECPDILSELFYDKVPETLRPEDYYDWFANHPLE